MTDFATLVLGADARGLAKGEAALDSIAATGAKTEAAINKAMASITDIAQLTAAAIKTAANTENLARMAAADAARNEAKEAAEAARRKAQAAQAAADAVAKAARQEEAAREAAAASYSALRSQLDPVYAASMRYAQAVETVQTAVKAGAVSQGQANRVLKMAEASYLEIAPAAQKAATVAAEAGAAMAVTGGKSSNMGFAVQNAAFQIGDFATQVSMGTSATRALGMQLPQLLGGFGVWGAVIGGAVAVLSGLVSVFDIGIDTIKKATDANQKYADSFDNISAQIDAIKSLQDRWQAAVQSGSDVQIRAITAEANIRQKLIQLEQIDLKQKSAAAATALASSQQELNAIMMVRDARNGEATAAYGSAEAQKKIVDLLIKQRDAAAQRNDALAVDSLNTQITEATGNYQRLEAEFENAQKTLAAQNKALSEQQSKYDKASLEWQLIGTQIAANNDRLGALGGVLQWIAGQTGSVAGEFYAAGTAAYTISSALQDAIGYMSALRGMINGLDFSNVSLAAENAALAAGQSINQANAAGKVAEAQYRLNDAIKSGDGIVRAAAQAELNDLKSKLDLNAQLLDANGKAVKAAKGAGAAGAKAAKEEKKYLQDIIDQMNGPMVSAVENVSGAIADWMTSGLQNADKMFKSILSGFKTMIRDMISNAIANPIKLAMGLTKDAQGNAIPGTGILGKITSGLQTFSTSFQSGFASFLTGGLGAVKTALSGATASLGGFATALGALAGPVAVVSMLFSAFHRTTTILASGLKITMQDLDATIAQFTTKKSSWLFGLISNTKTDSTPLDAAAADPIKAVIGDLQSNIMGAAKALGVGSDAFKSFAYEMTIDTKGMSKDQAIQAVQDKIAEMGDAFATMVPGLDKLRKLGEGASTALDRLASALSGVQSMTDTLGLSFALVGLSGAAVASKLADAFGGLDAMASATSAYYQKFYTEAEQTATATRQATAALDKLGLSMPKTRDQYRAMVEAQDLTTESGQKMFAALVGLSGVMDKVLPAVSNLTDALAQLVGNTSSQLDKMISTTDTAMQAAEQAATQWYQAADQLRAYIANLRGATNDLASATKSRAFNEAQFQMMLARALSGDSSAFGKLTNAADSLIASTNASAHTAYEAARDQARVLAGLSKAAGVADGTGGQQDVIAGLLGSQKDLLTKIKDYLSKGGVLDPKHVAALNRRLGALQGAINDAKSVDYAKIVAHMDFTATLVAKVQDPALRKLLKHASHEIEGMIAFSVNTEGMTPEERFLALRKASLHSRTVDLIASSQKLSKADAKLALQGASRTDRTIMLAMNDADLTKEDRRLALTTSSEVNRTINLLLGKNKLTDNQRHLALLTTDHVSRTIEFAVNGSIPKGANGENFRQVIFFNASETTRTVNLVLGEDLKKDDRSLALKSAERNSRWVNLLLGKDELSAQDKAIALALDSALTRKVNLALGTQDSKALKLATAETSSFQRYVSAVIDRKKTEHDAKALGLAADSGLERRVRAKIDKGSDAYAELLAFAESHGLKRTVFAVIDPKKSDKVAQNLGLAINSDLKRKVIASMDDSAMTRRQLAFLDALSGNTAGKITLGGSFVWDPSTGFQTLMKEKVADPLAGLSAPMANLQSSLTDLAKAVRDQLAFDKAKDALAAAEAKRQADLAAAQAKLSDMVGQRSAAVGALQTAVSKVRQFDYRTGGTLGKTVNGKQVLAPPTVNADGSLNYTADGVYGASAADLARWRAQFWADGGLEDQMLAANRARSAIDSQMAALRKLITDLGGVPGFATGGTHLGGLRLVGENGPELEATGPSRIYNHRQTKAMLQGGDQDAMLAELKALREELAALREEQRQLSFNSAVANKRTSETLRKWDTDGMPAVRA